MNTTLHGPRLGLTHTETRKLSVLDYVDAIIKRDAVRLGAYNDISRAVGLITGQDPEPGLLLPAELLTRTMTTQPGGKGGHAVGATIGAYGAPLDRAGLIDRLPLTRHTDLVGSSVIVIEAGKATATWMQEGVAASSVTETTFGQCSMTPKLAFGHLTASAALLRQAGDAGRAFIDRALQQTVTEAIGTALLQGAGGVEPMGILPNGSGSAGLAGVDTRAGTSFALSDGAAMLGKAEGYGSDESLVWVLGITAAEKLRQRVKLATYGNGVLLDDDGRMLGRRVVVSRLAPAAGVILAPWASVHYGSWGALQVRVDPSTFFTSGQVRIGVQAMVDFVHESPAQIAVATALT